MNLTCPHCKTKLNLPDDKVPADRASSFKCPKCKGVIQMKASKSASKLASKPASRQPSGSREGGGASGSGRSAGRFGRSTRIQAMVCMAPSRIRNQLTAAVEILGFSVDFPETPHKALKELEYRIYPLMVVDDAFDTDRQMAVHMNEMDMSLRRKICLVRVCQSEATGNDMAALHSSVNAVIRTMDIDQEDDLYIEDILNAAVTNHSKFYSIFNESLKAAGKA